MLAPASNGGTPSANLDTSFFGSLNIKGYVTSSQRGSVSGTASGVPASFKSVVHWYNDQAQYWTYADSSGAYKSPLMKPGTYTMKLYKGEYEVSSDSVTVTAGATATKNIASKEAQRTPIFHIGEFDGEPFELKNGDKITRMHPSDTRMSSWSGTYAVGSSAAKDFPMAIWSKQGSPATINFNLESSQVKELTLHIGTTLSFKGGRPIPKIGSWTGKDPGAPVSAYQVMLYGSKHID